MPGAICARRSASRTGAPGPYTPRTNGKAEAFIGTALREWAYRYAYPTSSHRTRALSGWVRWYNRRRPHSSLGNRPPISRVAQVRGYFS
jgi:transposase InsO family protein